MQRAEAEQAKTAPSTPPRKTPVVAWIGVASLALSACVGGRAEVERIQDGQRWSGRYIGTAAYAWYARGAYLEARGDLESAEQAYLEAAGQDPQSGAVWARIGAIRCARGREDADAAFESGMATENELLTVVLARGHCAYLESRNQEALDDGQEALSIDPNSIEASLLIVDALLALDRKGEARRWLDALAARRPGARIVQSRRLALAEAEGDAFRSARALSYLDPASDPLVLAQGVSALDSALSTGNLELARARAVALSKDAAEVALRALALGQPELALRQARLVLAARPTSVDARIAGLVAADLLRDAAAFDALLQEAPGNGSDVAREPNPLAALLFAELLERRAGAEAANAWLVAHQVEASRDPVVEELRKRVAGERPSRN